MENSTSALVFTQTITVRLTFCWHLKILCFIASYFSSWWESKLSVIEFVVVYKLRTCGVCQKIMLKLVNTSFYFVQIKRGATEMLAFGWSRDRQLRIICFFRFLTLNVSCYFRVAINRFFWLCNIHEQHVKWRSGQLMVLKVNQVIL